MNGNITRAGISDGKIKFNFLSGESRILRTYTTKIGPAASPAIDNMPLKVIDLTHNNWNLAFDEGTTEAGNIHKLPAVQSWETLGDKESVMMGTGIYTTRINLDKNDSKRAWRIDLGDVRESARVYINGEYIGCAWAAPYILDCAGKLKKGKNELRIEVTNLPANRIADLDKKGVDWRIMKEINVVDINYKKTSYEGWTPMPSGLNSTVKLISGANGNGN